MAIVPLKGGKLLLKCCLKQTSLEAWLRLKCSIWAQEHQQRLEREYINAIKERKSDAAICTDSSDVTKRAAPHAASVDGAQNADRKKKKNIRTT